VESFRQQLNWRCLQWSISLSFQLSAVRSRLPQKMGPLP
jgi:hypothetical protein